MRARIPPPVLLALSALACFGIDRINTNSALKFTPNQATGYVFFAAGLIIMVWSVLIFKRTKTTVNPIHPERAKVLVTSGPFRISRNPMYLGMIFILFASLMAFGDYLGFAVFAVFLIYMDQVQIKAEEIAMRANFGNAFEAYSAKVRRWV